MLGASLSHIPWTTVTELIDSDQIGRAIEVALGREHSPSPMIAVGAMIVSLVILAWPAKRNKQMMMAPGHGHGGV
jgi:hypothetical protein